ncbi:MAG: hypothetical protein KBF88_06045 [Polyangiaceae bacterium]|nr:hypothetical protein [Polyangiaceae bacterium]
MNVGSLLVSTLVLSAFAAFGGCSSSENVPADNVDAAVTPKLGPNDVSVLYPLPAAASTPGYLTAKDTGEKGMLLPKATYDEIPLFGVKPAEGLDYARMRVLAVRFDGCFPGPNGCEAQVRLVMQPVTDKTKSLDSALHLFYRVPDDQLAVLVSELRKLRELAPERRDDVLAVHPALLAQGVEGAYGAGLRSLVMRFCGDQTFTRMTFFLRAPPVFEKWFFGGFDAKDGVLTQLNIVGIGKSNQMVDRVDTPEGYNYVFTPDPKTPENISPLLVTETAKTAEKSAIDTALTSLARLENPAIHGPDDLACAGCHVTTVVRSFAEKELGASLSKIPDAYTGSLRGESEAATTRSSLRAFGYFGAKPMIANRVVHETELVVKDLGSRFPATK